MSSVLLAMYISVFKLWTSIWCLCRLTVHVLSKKRLATLITNHYYACGHVHFKKYYGRSTLCCLILDWLSFRMYIMVIIFYIIPSPIDGIDGFHLSYFLSLMVLMYFLPLLNEWVLTSKSYCSVMLNQLTSDTSIPHKPSHSLGEMHLKFLFKLSAVPELPMT